MDNLLHQLEELYLGQEYLGIKQPNILRGSISHDGEVPRQRRTVMFTVIACYWELILFRVSFLHRTLSHFDRHLLVNQWFRSSSESLIIRVLSLILISSLYFMVYCPTNRFYWSLVSWTHGVSTQATPAGSDGCEAMLRRYFYTLDIRHYTLDIRHIRREHSNINIVSPDKVPVAVCDPISPFVRSVSCIFLLASAYNWYWDPDNQHNICSE